MDKLIISPHIDDEVLGCGGILDSNSFVLECGVDKFHIVSRDRRIEELKKAQEILGFEFETLSNLIKHNLQIDVTPEPLEKFLSYLE